jgi:sugar phosphate permease
MKRNIHYAWVILVVIFFTLVAVQGVRLSFGAFIEPWEKEFAADRGTISLISTVSFIVYGLSQPFIGRLIDRFGVRMILSVSALLVGVSLLLSYPATALWQMFVLYGIVISFGVGGASNVAATVAVTNWFHEKRGLAFGIMEAGFGAGQLILVPASLFFIHSFDWQWTVIVLGLFLLIAVFPTAWLLLRNRPAEKNLQPIGGYREEEQPQEKHQQPQKPSDWSVVRTRQFWFLVLPFFICGYTTTGLMDTHLIPFAQLCGFPTAVTGTAVSLLAAFNILGTLLSGYVADRWSSRKFLACLYACRAATIIVLAVFVSNVDFLGFFVNHPSLLLIFAISFGMVDFATVAPTQMLATQYFKQGSVGLILGWLFFSHQIGSALGAYFPGLLYNATGDYNLAFYSAFLLLAGASVLNLFLPEPRKVAQTRPSVSPSEA